MGVTPLLPRMLGRRRWAFLLPDRSEDWDFDVDSEGSHVVGHTTSEWSVE